MNCINCTIDILGNFLALILTQFYQYQYVGIQIEYSEATYAIRHVGRGYTM